MTQGIWTLDELTERVGAALSVGYHGQPSGRVRDLPDRRAIRWYTTIGLVDRPAAMRGRTALYGPRHLLQLAAIKRLQARGLPLVAIQAQLAGATDAQLARVAQVPEEALPAPVPPPRQPATRDGLPTTHAAPTAPAPPAGTAAAPALGAGTARPARFWRERPVAAATPATAATADLAGPDGGDAVVTTLRGVRLGEGATLLLEPARPLDAADLRAILDAARPLLEALRARGLDGGPGGRHPGDHRRGGNRPAGHRPGGLDPGREHQ
jgi:DNA-binding transcriptional MerR regulator